MSFRKFDLETPFFIAKNIFPQFCKNMTSYIHDVNKARSHGNIVLFSKDAEYVNIQSEKVSDTSQTTRKPGEPPTNQPHTGQIAHKPANYQKKISFLCYQKLQRYCKTCAKFATILLIALRFSNEDQSQVGIEGK